MKRIRPAPDGPRLPLSAALGAYRHQSGGERSINGTESSSLRIPAGFSKPWRSRWFAKQGYAKLLQEDLELKEGLRDRLKSAGVSSIEVDRPGNKLRVTIRTSRPGIIIGRKGAEIEKLKQDLAKRTKREVFIDIQEVHKPELDAQLVSESIALQLEKRVAFRRAMRKAVDSALRFGCKGIKVRVSGRLNGAEIARSEVVSAGAASAAHAARRYRLRLHRSAHHLRRHRHQGLAVQRARFCDQARGAGIISEPSRDRGRAGSPRDRDRRGRREPAPAVRSAPNMPDRATQAAPSDLPRPARTGGPIMPPLMAPQPTWKQEARPEPAVETKDRRRPPSSQTGTPRAREPAPEVKPDEGSQS